MIGCLFIFSMIWFWSVFAIDENNLFMNEINIFHYFLKYLVYCINVFIIFLEAYFVFEMLINFISKGIKSILL
jgi:hypothetical protein